METKFTIPNYILAPKTTRALNFAIDIVFMNIINSILYFIAAFIAFDAYSSLLDWLNSFDKAQNFLFWTILMFLYYATFEIVFARTISKYFTKTIVVRIDGSKPKPIDILGRTLVRIIPFEYFTFFRGRKLGWHDELSKTFVVVKSKLENSKKEFLELQNF
ncbi:RDD family protein [Flavobacterium franklandianum]|nr:RDD family protein [Flavobacterium franklandianum]TRX25387.1 RDD family protein [Flavobacterium franklandianum]